MSEPDLTGSLVDGRYRVRGRLGGGRGGTVYRAISMDGGPEVALKVLRTHVARPEKMRARFEREARALNGLEHPHLIRMLDFGFHDGAPYHVTELLSGTPLDQLLSKGELPPPQAYELGVGVVAGLAHAHRHGVLHRDIKPSNVFVAVLPGGQLHPKLLDFGLVRFTDSSRWGAQTTLTEVGTVLGTPTYMPPEQGFGAAADTRSDVYSVGVLVYELLTGRPPFERSSRTSLIRAHAMDPVPRMTEVRGDLWLQPALEALVLRALEKRADDRFVDAPALLTELQSVPEPPARYR